MGAAPSTPPADSQPASRRWHGGAGPWVLPWPLALAIVIAIHLVSAWYALGLQLNNAPDLYYPKGSPAVELRDDLRRDFPGDEMLTVVFQGPDLYGQDFLSRLNQLAQTLERHPLVDRVTTVTTLERISGTADGFSISRLVDPRGLDEAAPDKTRQRVLDDRFAPGLLASRDGSTLAMAVRPKPLAGSSDRLLLQVAVATAINEAGLRRYYAGDAGPITVDVAQLISMVHDTRLFVPLTAALGLLLLGWMVGRLRPVLIGAVAMSTVILPIVAGIAAAGQPYTMASAMLPSLLAAYTMATLLHLYAAVQRAQAARLSRRASVQQALAETLRPGAYNVLTTGAGLLSLVLVPLPPIQVFGIAGAAGTALVFLTVYFLVPAFLLSWDNRRWPTRRSTMRWFGRAAAHVAIFSMRRPRLILGGMALVSVACIPIVGQVDVETDVLEFFSPSHAVNRHTDIVESKLAGVTSLEISLVGDQRDALQDVATLKAVRAFQDWLEAMPEVDRSVSMVDLVEEMHWAMNGERVGFRVLPPSDRLLSQYLLVYDGQDLYELVNRDFQHARIMLNLNVHGARQIGQTIDKIRQQVQAQPLPGVTVDVGGYGRLFADQVDLLVSGQVRSFAAAFVQIFLLMAFLWRSFRAAAICMVPNLAPLYFIFVLMGAAAIHLDSATVLIASVMLGITVDDTIHLYHGYRHRLALGLHPALAIARTYQSAGRAVLATSVLLTAQFGLLATSDFIPTANFGLMTAVGLLAGLAGEFLLPPMLVFMHTQGQGRTRWRLLGSSRRKADTAAAADSAWAPTQLIDRPAPEGSIVAMASEPVAGPMASSPPEEAADAGPVQVLVCMGPACMAKGAVAVWRGLAQAMPGPARPDIEPHVKLVETSCVGTCASAPVVQVLAAPPRQGTPGESSAELVQRTLQAVQARTKRLQR